MIKGITVSGIIGYAFHEPYIGYQPDSFRQGNHMKENKRTIGAVHEEMAADFLKKQGFSIIEMNYRTRRGEIDIVAREGRYLVFCEVKFRKTSAFGNPLLAVDRKKQRQISYTALSYLRKNRISEYTPIRFDVIAMMPDQISHFRNAFDFCP